MNKFMKIYLPGTCIIFTLSMLSTIIINTLYGGIDYYHIYMLELLGLIILFQVLDQVIAKINFRTYKAYFITEYMVMFCAYLVAGVIFHWFNFNLKNIIVIAIPFTLIFIGIHYYFRSMFKKEADRINQLLN